jgi:hypothetical protein
VVANGYPYGFQYDLFRPLRATNGSTYWALRTPDSPFDASNIFNVTDGGRNRTGFDKGGEFSTRYGHKPWYENLTCTAFECARRCAERIEGWVRPNITAVETSPVQDLDTCVQACPGMGWNHTDYCITKSDTVAGTSGDVGAVVTTVVASTPPTMVATETASTTKSTSRASGTSVVWRLLMGEALLILVYFVDY